MFENEKIPHSRGRHGQHGVYVSIRLHVTCPCSGDDEAPDPPRDSEAAHHGHWHDAPDVQSARRLQAGQGDMLRTKISCFELKIAEKLANQVPPGL